MKSPRILFVIPKTKSMFGEEGNVPVHPHVGIAYLVAVLKKHHYQVSVFDEGLEQDDQKLFQIIWDFQPQIIGVTMFSYCYAQAYQTIVKIKKRHKIPLIVGGPHVSATRSSVLRETEADFALKGEGEESFLDFLQEFVAKKPNFSKVPGLIWRSGRKIIENSPGSLIKDLDNLPLPDYEAFNLEKYSCFQTKTLPLLTSRGCPYGCTYCSVRLSMGRGFRPRSPKNVLAEIEFWHQKGFTNFDINDDCFTLDLKRAEQICDDIFKKRLKIHFQLYNGIRVDRISLPLLKKLKKAGCTFIAYGCEAGNDRILRIIQKAITLDQVRKAVEWTNKAGIRNAVNFIIGHPQEKYADAQDSIKFAQSLPTDFVNFYNLVPYPGTEVYDWAMNNARFIYPKESFLKDVSYRDNVPIYETKEFTKLEREEIMRQGFALYEKKVMQFRLGKLLGSVAYFLSRPPFLHDPAINFALNNQIGRRIFLLLSSKSRE